MSNTTPLFRWICLLFLTSTLLLTGCDDSSLVPASPPSDASSPGVLSAEEEDAPQTIDDQFLAVAKQIPEFGGMYVDAEGVLNVYVTTTEGVSEGEVLDVLEAEFGDLDALAANPRLDIDGLRDLRLVEGLFPFANLFEWHAQSDVVFEAEGIHTLDIDEGDNRIRVVGVDEVALMEASALLDDAGVPAHAVVFEEAPAPVRTATLRDKIRPVEGGLQIAFDNNLCTYGFTAYRNGIRGFITNAHCSTSMFTVTPTYYYQPSRISANYIGYEYTDPALRSGRYRYSDAAFVRLTPSVNSRLGDIARTTGWSYQTGSGSLTIDSNRPHIEIDAERTSIATGTLLDKIGRTTGWTYGPVESTCQTVNMGSYTLYCQDEVYAFVDGGDSGSPVFYWKGDTDNDGLDNGELAGVLWGGRTYPSGKKTFLFSRIYYVEYDIGALTTH